MGCTELYHVDFTLLEDPCLNAVDNSNGLCMMKVIWQIMKIALSICKYQRIDFQRCSLKAFI